VNDVTEYWVSEMNLELYDVRGVLYVGGEIVRVNSFTRNEPTTYLLILFFLRYTICTSYI
jgi:hypothetical protein